MRLKEVDPRNTIVVCRLPDGLGHGVLTRWLKGIGTAIDPGESVAEICIGTIQTLVPAPAKGFLYRTLFDEGDAVWAGDYIAILTDWPNRPPGCRSAS